MANLNIGNSTANVKVTLNQNGDVHFRNGTLDFDSSSLLQFSETPQYLVGIESFTNGGTLKWAGKADVSVGSADKLTTARTINGTSFNGSANITTANWGTTRTITIGNTGKSVNGSSNISWTLSEIGAAASRHTHTAATTSANGFMSSDDKAKLDGITASADAVSFSRSLTSGTKVGTITINGTGTDLYAPTNTDTHWTTGITAGETGTTSNSATTNGNTFIKIKDNSTHRGQIKLVGSGATSVSSNAEGVITISSTDNNTTYGSMSVSEGTTGTATTNRVLTAANLKGIINAHAPTKTGGGASGTWGISISGNAATASKVNNKLTVGSKSYDGSAAVTIEASDLGLASAMLFLGTTTTAITDGATTNPVVLGGSNKTVTAGNVVLYGSKEFVWTGSAWEELGNEGSYKIVQAAVADPSASGTSNTFIATISQDANGKITATKKTVAVTNSAPTLAWNTTSTIGTVAGTNLQVKMPANPNTDTKVTQTVTTSNAAYPLLLAPNGQTATTTTTSYFDSGVTLNPSTNTIAANVSGNAATATISRSLGSDDTMKIYAQSSNEVNFGGTSNLNTIYFGYRAKDSKPIPSKFIFGGDGTAELIAAKFTGTLNGNAATATNVAWSGITNKPSYYDIPKYTSNIGPYGSPDTHILKLGYWNCTYSYDNLTLLVSSSFWGNQHGSTDIITLRQDLNDHSGGLVKCSCNRVTLMNSGRTFYYNIDQTNRRVYLYVYVTGGNQYGKWNTSVLQSNGGYWVSEFAANQTKQSSFVTIDPVAVYGAVWNDYAEYRSSNITEPGRVIVENGDGTLSLSTERLQRGAEIISDTFGFAIGETDECKTPIAATGRVLAYTYEPVEEYKRKIGWPVCSGPNGTISIMTEEEEEKYPSCIIGTVSEIPTYEKWGTGNVEVNGRIWIRIR